LFGKSTNCKLDPKTNQLQRKCIAGGGFLEEAFRSWWIYRTSISQLMDFPDKHFAVGGFL